MWKWLAIGLIVAVTALICGYLVVREFQEQQMSFNQALADNAITTNQQLVEIRTQLAALEEAINNLDGQHSEDIARIDQALRDQQAAIDANAQNIQRNTDNYYDLNSKYWELEDRISKLECDVYDPECEAPETCPNGDCGCTSGCSTGCCYDCGYCYDCSRYYGP